MVLPIITLSLPMIAAVARMTRASLIETLNSPYIRTAKAKGLPLRLILIRHASRETLLPILSWLGPCHSRRSNRFSRHRTDIWLARDRSLLCQWCFK